MKMTSIVMNMIVMNIVAARAVGVRLGVRIRTMVGMRGARGVLELEGGHLGVVTKMMGGMTIRKKVGRVEEMGMKKRKLNLCGVMMAG